MLTRNEDAPGAQPARGALISLPGIDGSGPDHWQSIWEAGSPEIVRFQPASWEAPDLDDWVAALDRAVGAIETPLLIAHSLSCLLVAHWAARSDKPVCGAFMVAVPDWGAASFPVAASGFRDPPLSALRFPILAIASLDDPFARPDHVERCAEAWGGSSIVLGELGHVNEASGLGAWPEGRRLLTAFARELGLSPRF